MQKSSRNKKKTVLIIYLYKYIAIKIYILYSCYRKVYCEFVWRFVHSCLSIEYIVSCYVYFVYVRCVIILWTHQLSFNSDHRNKSKAHTSNQCNPRIKKWKFTHIRKYKNRYVLGPPFSIKFSSCESIQLCHLNREKKQV